jgi:hypothetical protein
VKRSALHQQFGVSQFFVIVHKARLNLFCILSHPLEGLRRSSRVTRTELLSGEVCHLAHQFRAEKASVFAQGLIRLDLKLGTSSWTIFCSLGTSVGTNLRQLGDEYDSCHEPHLVLQIKPASNTYKVGYSTLVFLLTDI